MKKKTDPRHQSRVKIVKSLFESNFQNKSKSSKNSQVNEILLHKNKIDSLIQKNAPRWPIAQIAPIDLSTLRLAIWELMFKKKKEPYKAVIDEAVEIAKEYGSQSSPKFINGVLGIIIKSQPK